MSYDANTIVCNLLSEYGWRHALEAAEYAERHTGGCDKYVNDCYAEAARILRDRYEARQVTELVVE